MAVAVGAGTARRARTWPARPARPARPATLATQAWHNIDLHGVRLDESSADGKPRSWIMIAPIGTFQHERYGELDFTRAKLAEMKRNFDERVRHIDIALDVDHDQGAAPGWFERLELREDGLYGLVRWTPYGEKLLKEEQYRYFSPEFGDWTDPETEQTYHNVLMGGALTNRPFLKTMGDVHLSDVQRAARDIRFLHDAVAEAVRLMEISNRSWGSVNKSKLPRACFLIQGDPDDKSTWKLPVYEGAGPLDADGHYTKRGPLNINGVRAALQAIGGARTGTAMSGVPASVKARLERWIQQYGKSGGNSSKAASERAGATSKDGGDQVGKRDSRQLKDQREDLEIIEDEDESYQLSAEDSGDMDGSYDEDTSGDEPDEEKNDGDEDEDDQDEAVVSPDADRHGPMTTKGHLHGKYAEHSHDGDADHSEAPLKRGRKAMSEGRRKDERAMTLAERRMLAEMKQLREENAKIAYRLYETEVGKQLEEWKAGKTFTYRAGMKDGKPVTRTGRLGFSRVFAERYKAFMLAEGFKLSEKQRGAFNDVIEAALGASVDLTARGSSYDQEARRTTTARDRRPGGSEDSEKLEETAQRMALAEEGKPLEALEADKQMALYRRAAKEIGYR